MFFRVLILILNFLQIYCELNENLKIALIPLKNEPFELVVTLGNCCLTKFRVMSYHKLNPKFKTVNHLFDWMNPLNYTAMGKSVENDLNDAFGLDHLIIRNSHHSDNIKVVANSKYEFEFRHVFDGLFSLNQLTEEMFHKYFRSIETKFDHLVQNSKYAFFDNKKTLYIVYVGLDETNLEKNKQDDFLSFLHSLKLKRNDNFLLLVLVTDELSLKNKYNFDVLIEGNIIFHMINEYRIAKWNCKESLIQWDNILNLFFD